ncbi:hypothetical protein Hdeb2414_s0008g00263731 [Helianthus debilis subsp. tardiflorus]
MSCLPDHMLVLKLRADVLVRAYYSDICVGSIACRLEKKERIHNDIRCFSTLSWPRYRYKAVIDLSSRENVGEIYLHVKTNNEDAT